MRNELKEFMDLVQKDVSLQKKLEEAGKNYTGEQTQEAAFENVVVPIAKEAGFSLSVDDLKQAVQKLDLEELSQVTGGDNEGVGATACYGIGGGWGINKDTGCWFIGIGGGTMACFGEGKGERLYSGDGDDE